MHISLHFVASTRLVFPFRTEHRKAHVRTMVVCVALMLVAMMAYAGFPSFRGEDKETLTRDFDTEAYVGAWGRHLGTNGTSIKQCSDLSDDDHLYKKCMCGKNKHQHKCAKVHCCSAELLPGSVHGECVTSFDLNGGIVIYSLILLYLFIVLAYVCDDYFCASLEGITERLKLSPGIDRVPSVFSISATSWPIVRIIPFDCQLSCPYFASSRHISHFLTIFWGYRPHFSDAGYRLTSSIQTIDLTH